MSSNIENTTTTTKTKKNTLHLNKEKSTKSNKQKPSSSGKPSEAKANIESAEFESEYNQEKLYLEEIFNTLYLSFDNPAQSANAMQYMQLLQQERMNAAAQSKPLQAGLAQEEMTGQQMGTNPTATGEQENEQTNEDNKEDIKEEIKDEEIIIDEGPNIEDNQSETKQKPEVKKKPASIKVNENNAKTIKSLYLGLSGKKAAGKNQTPGSVAKAPNAPKEQLTKTKDPNIFVFLIIW